MITLARYSIRDNRTMHERFCDYEVEKAHNRKVVYGGIKVGRNPQVGVKKYSTYEVKKMLEKELTKSGYNVII